MAHSIAEDIHSDLMNIVIGPQGVFEEALATGTHRETWLGIPPSGERVEFGVLILFPWDSKVEKFSGERIFIRGKDVPL